MGRAGRHATIGWDGAAATIARGVSARPFVVGVTGPQGSGKSTLARAIADVVSPALVVSTDRYLPDYARLERDAYDLPDHADLPLLARHVRALREGHGVELPVWSFRSHAREGYETIAGEAGRVIVVEGIHALAGPVRGLLDLAVFVEAGAPVRLARVIAREKDRGWGEAEAAAFMREVADPVFERFAGAYRAGADVVVVNG